MKSIKMSNKKMNQRQGHWILAKMGKRVLRPGGRELTEKMIDNLDIQSTDNVVEFAPGLGFTAEMTLSRKPKSYTGVELNEEAATILRKKIKGENLRIIVGNARESTIESSSVDKVYGEAMLTMQPDDSKMEIIKEALRILKVGGLYGIHELGLKPNDIPEETKSKIHRELTQVIQVNARPLTVSEWTGLLEKVGFEVVAIETNPMYLLERKRMIGDEGFFRYFKIKFNILTHPKERRRIKAMKSVFRKYKDHLNAVSIVAKKKEC